MISFTRVSTDEEMTAALAGGLADVLSAGDVVLLEGDLGAGKTTFTRALAEALGVKPGHVSSPTFIIVNVYPVTTMVRGIARLVHVDAYRVTSDEDLEPLGWDQLFDPQTKQAAGDAVALVEWPGNISRALPDVRACVQVRIAATGMQSRSFSVTLPDAVAARPLAGLLAERPPARCPKSKRWTKPTAATYPFVDKRAQDSDLFGWLTDSYTVPAPRKED
ncbi:MAG TPA: tRNA (adenosine(37)-N6)-threonylcarbamoyltransferase complex ATPase subunit type 1 TsaE [Phycisphaerales bacterium]|nr:tRNA (adenosine(37)-N6)-threonylcarbamoyltransferase complex ATPase subunit type 1 TsaE [Phycisphaerales bacterium]